MTMQWKGVMPAVLTHFTANDEVDITMLEKNTKAQLDAGVHGIILGGTLGEASTLSDEEKATLIRETQRIVNGVVPVVMNIAEQSTKKAIQVAQQAEANGANGLMILPPMRYKANDLETVAYFSEIADNTTLPIMIYNNPYDYKIEVTIPMFEQLLKKDNIQAVKDSSRDLTNVTRYKNAFGDRLKILGGVDTIALESLLLGADGWVAGLVDAFPAETVAIYTLVKVGRIEEALDIYRWFMPLLELDIDPQLVQNIKLAAVATGISNEFVRKPRLPLQGTQREHVLHVIKTSIANRPTLPDYKNI
jgi:4-hydroxy-tetrahydrodipicolinate synthase